jgi:hypothetical protein
MTSLYMHITMLHGWDRIHALIRTHTHSYALIRIVGAKDENADFHSWFPNERYASQCNHRKSARIG